MIDHQAVRKYAQSMFTGVLKNKLKKLLAIGVSKENLQLAIATLRYVMRNSWYHNSGSSGHIKGFLSVPYI